MVVTDRLDLGSRFSVGGFVRPVRSAWMGFAALAGIATLMLAGCGGSDMNAVPVSGKVTVDGEPAENIMVNFQPTEGTEGPGSAGLTSADGTYSLQVVGSDSQPGTVVGTHTVTLVYKDPSEDPSVDHQAEPEEPPVSLPPKAYNQSITFEVPPEGTDSANFEF